MESNYWARAIITERFKYVMEYRPRFEEDFMPSVRNPTPWDSSRSSI